MQPRWGDKRPHSREIGRPPSLARYGQPEGSLHSAGDAGGDIRHPGCGITALQPRPNPKKAAEIPARQRRAPSASTSPRTAATVGASPRTEGHRDRPVQRRVRDGSRSECNGSSCGLRMLIARLRPSRFENFFVSGPVKTRDGHGLHLGDRHLDRAESGGRRRTCVCNLTCHAMLPVSSWATPAGEDCNLSLRLAHAGVR